MKWNSEGAKTYSKNFGVVLVVLTLLCIVSFGTGSIAVHFLGESPEVEQAGFAVGTVLSCFLFGLVFFGFFTENEGY